MSEPDDTLRAAIDVDLFGDGGLAEPAEVTAPDKYRLVRCLGRGGFGAVYLAVDTALQRSVALKFLTEARPADVERFRREARYAGRLSDPAIVRIYELGEHDGQPYIAMQYVDGKDLDAVELDPTALARVARSVGQALAHAHSLGIVHRDVKPGNILIDREGRAFVTDFGIARNLHGDRGGTLSFEGQIIGTPGLMPPEQARGDRGAMDARTDIYALGATLFAKLTGRMPFDGVTLVDVLHAVIHDPVPFPRSIRPDIPRSLEALVLKCMQKDPRDRYADMSEVVADLDRYLAGLPVAGESAAWFRRLVGAPAAPPKPDAATDPHLPAVLEVAREIAAWDANLYRVSSNLPRTFPPLDAAIDRLGRVLSARPDFAVARFHRGLALFRRGRLREALEEMERAIDRVGDVPGAHFELGRLYLALFLREQEIARKHISKTGTHHHMESVRARLEQAAVALAEAQRLNESSRLWQVDYARAVEKLAQGDPDGCVAICDEVLARDPDIEELWKLRGDALRFAHRDPHESYDRAVGVRRCFYEALYAKAEAYLEHGQPWQAREVIRRALEINPEFADGHMLLARAWMAEGRLEEASAGATRAVELDPQSFDATVTNAELLIEMGRASKDRDCFDLAIEALGRAREMPGCGNRVEYITARAWLERARLGGADARADLDRVLAFRTADNVNVPDNAPWVELLKEAEAERERITG